MVPLDGSADPFTSTWAQSPSWAPDGQRLAFESLSGIFVANVKTRKTRLVGGTSLSACPVWSPNGKWIAVCSSKDARTHQFHSLDVITPTGASRRRLVKGGVITPVAWAPSSEAILFSRVKDDRGVEPRQLFIVSLRDHQVIPVPGTLGAMGSASWHR